MSNTRKRRAVRTSLSAIPTTTALRCECRHRSEPDGQCNRDATARATLVCQVRGCDCAAEVHLVCDDCLEQWKHSAARDGVKPRIRTL